MAAWASNLRPNVTMSCIVLGAVGVSLGFSVRVLMSQNSTKETVIIPSPRATQLPKLSKEETSALPYPPDALPGARDVETPYGTIKVFEWGPEDGEKVLLLHGISTPCLSLGILGEALVERGYRVMVFDFFGRGYSDAPTDIPYDIRLYSTQMLLALASSKLPWTGDNGFHIIGYSLGGGLAVSFAKYYSHMIRSLVLVASGGLIRSEHVSRRSRILYSKGVLPEPLLRWLVRRRITPQPATTTSEAKMASEVVATTTTATTTSEQSTKKHHKNSDASGGDSFDNAVLSPHRPNSTVSSVMAWQVQHQQGFLTAFMSSIRHAPIYEQREDWMKLGQLLAARRKASSASGADEDEESVGGRSLPGLLGGKVLLVLGSTDPVIVKEELIHDAISVLGEDGFEAVVLDCGHEIVMTRGEEVAGLAAGFWSRI
ncbi:alpha/beta-hydrolase [Pseudoneurospora amorphoporcata]|uniref:Alpha/beta-hydrolase n=1 Tax=Pseudoneurospora amorphoporcata TaxID=241081 RepID=A0AAN6P3T6_9PEZI|nr:alpha/beta-hydrolase [Pseudoneurospora amorphoporcata]